MTDLAHLHVTAATPAIGTHPAAAADRLHALDAVRGFALLLGIFFHATMSFLVADGPAWLVTDTSSSSTLTIAFYVLHMFRMATFFLIAGFFAHLSFHR